MVDRLSTVSSCSWDGKDERLLACDVDELDGGEVAGITGSSLPAANRSFCNVDMSPPCVVCEAGLLGGGAALTAGCWVSVAVSSCCEVVVVPLACVTGGRYGGGKRVGCDGPSVFLCGGAGFGLGVFAEGPGIFGLVNIRFLDDVIDRTVRAMGGGLSELRKTGFGIISSSVFHLFLRLQRNTRTNVPRTTNPPTVPPIIAPRLMLYMTS